MSINVDRGSQISTISAKQQQISKLVRESARKNIFHGLNFRNNSRLSPEEESKSRKIRVLTPLQTPVQEQEIEQSKKLRQLIVKLQPETSDILKKNLEQRKEEIKLAREKSLREEQAERDRENTENRRLINKYFKDSLKNLPQKGRKANYNAYNNSFRRAFRRPLTNYSAYNSSFQSKPSRGHTNYNEFNNSFQTIPRRGHVDYSAYNSTLQPIKRN
ncbi:MAG: hypothetical protein HQM13_23795 [SAR324 cluster bacterium]|nr:hypothetical protein [SAR324 cluster bacterium]